MNRDSAVPRPLSAPPAARRSALRALPEPSREADAQLALSLWLRLLKARSLVLKELRPRIPEGLTIPQFDALAQLQRRPLGMTPGELTRELLVTAGNVTGIVARLARRGLLERRPVPADRRTVMVRLTARGRSLMRRAIPQHRRDVQSLLAGVSRADQARLRDLLATLIEALRFPQRSLSAR